MATSTDLLKKIAESIEFEKTPQNQQTIDHLLIEIDRLRENRPSIVLAKGKTRRSVQTIQKVIKYSFEVFLEEGHAGLTLRKVADRAGIAVGNLTYHFPSKRILLNTIVSEKTAEYLDDHAAQIRKDRDDPLKALLNIVGYHVRRAVNDTDLFYQLWGYAGSSDDARIALHLHYSAFGAIIYLLMYLSNPNLSNNEIRRYTWQIGGLIEGYKIFMGIAQNAEAHHAINAAEEDVRRLTKLIIMGE